jgi:hypothetical protein
MRTRGLAGRIAATAGGDRPSCFRSVLSGSRLISESSLPPPAYPATPSAPPRGPGRPTGRPCPVSSLRSARVGDQASRSSNAPLPPVPGNRGGNSRGDCVLVKVTDLQGDGLLRAEPERQMQGNGSTGAGRARIKVLVSGVPRLKKDGKVAAIDHLRRPLGTTRAPKTVMAVAKLPRAKGTTGTGDPRLSDRRVSAPLRAVAQEPLNGALLAE